MKKTLAILLSLALIVCMIPMSVFAETGVDPSKATLTATTEVYNGQNQMPIVKVNGVAVDNSLLTWKKGKLETAESFASAESVPSTPGAGTYSVLIEGSGSFASAEKVIKQFTITPYDLSKVYIIIDDQIAVPGSDSLAALAEGSVTYYYNGKPIKSEDAALIFNGAISVKFEAITANKEYKATFTINNDKKGNFTEDTLPEARFNIVTDIGKENLKPDSSDPDDHRIELRPANGNVKMAEIPGGDYDGKAKAVETLFSLYDTVANKKLIYGTDYSISCTEATKKGRWTVTIKGKGVYGGTRTETLDIKARDAKEYVKADAIPDQTSSSQRNIEVVLKDSKLNYTLKIGDDYLAKTIVGREGETGSVEITFINNYRGDTLYLPFNVVSEEKNVQNDDIQVYYGTTNVTSGGLSASAYLYNGSAQPLNNIVVYTDSTKKTVLSSSYYSLSYEYTDKDRKTVAVTSPIEAQDYDVYLVGKNGYAGKRHLGTYKIPKYNTSNVTVSVAMANAASAPTVIVKSKYENITFVKDKDYTFTHYVNTTTGKVYVSVYPTNYGNLTGASISDYYPIVAKSITSCTATFTNGKNSVAYTGYTIPVDVTVKDGYYTTLTKGTHYTVAYKDAAGKSVTSIKDAGVYTVEITGIGVYTGKLTLTFTVTGNDISGYTVTLKESSVNVSDKAQTPVIESVKKGTTTLASTNYTVSYQDATGKAVTSMKDPGTYRVVVTGKGAYSGSTYATFRIIGLTQTVTPEKSIYKAYYNYSDPFIINAKASAATSLTYTSSNPSVANVSATGTVTVNKVGRTVITITAPATGKYESATETVVVRVFPKKGVMSRGLWTDGKQKQLKVRWYLQDGATQYQIRYSRKSDFSTYATKKVAPYGNIKYVTNTATIKNLKAKTKYYVKVRAVYTDELTGEIYYGNWSAVKSLKTK